MASLSVLPFISPNPSSLLFASRPLAASPYLAFAFPPHRPSPLVSLRARLNHTFELSDDSSPPQDQDDTGPIELPPELDPFAMPEVSPLQTAASVVLTGAIGFFLYRSLRRRAKRAKEVRFRSSGAETVKDQAKEELLSSLKKVPELEKPPPSISQTLLGAVISGGIALILYKFATGVEAGFAGKPVSSVYTIRQLTITIRTIINGLCYLATFAFAANSLGLTLYSIQLAFNIGQTQLPLSKEDDNTDAKSGEMTRSDDIVEKE